MLNPYHRSPAKISFVRTALAAAVLLTGLVDSASAFEGYIRQRTVQVEGDALTALAPDAATNPSSAFAISAEQLDSSKAGINAIETTVAIRGQRMRIDGFDSKDPGSFMLIDTDDGTSYAVLPAKRQIMRMTTDDAKQISDTIAAMRESMLEQMKQMGVDPSTIPGFDAGNDADTPQPKVVALDKTITINGISAQGYEVQMDGKPARRAWVTSEHPDLAALFASAQRHMRALAPQGAAGADAEADRAISEKGLPVRTQNVRTGRNGGLYQVTELVAIERTTIDQARMELPSDGYETVSAAEQMRASMPKGPGGMPGMPVLPPGRGMPRGMPQGR